VYIESTTGKEYTFKFCGPHENNTPHGVLFLDGRHLKNVPSSTQKNGTVLIFKKLAKKIGIVEKQFQPHVGL
jgi:hypothetical protein